MTTGGKQDYRNILLTTKKGTKMAPIKEMRKSKYQTTLYLI